VVTTFSGFTRLWAVLTPADFGFGTFLSPRLRASVPPAGRLPQALYLS
jgi:hypothetical protein